MVAILKMSGMMCCGVVLYLGLGGHAVSAADDMNPVHAGERIGGQGGRGFEHVYREHVGRLTQVNESADKLDKDTSQ